MIASKTSPARPLLWILEDDQALQAVYAEILGNTYQLNFFSTIEAFKEASSTFDSCDLLIADLQLQDKNFLDFLCEPNAHLLLRSPFMVISSMDAVDTLRQCFSEGALDYLTKPFTASELVVKIERLLRTSAGSGTDKNGAENVIELDASKLRVKSGCHETRLTAKELQIFSLLHQSKGSAVSRNRLQSEVWGDAKVSQKSLDVHIFHLRRKIAKLNLEIECDPSGGFRLKGPAEA